MTDQCRNTPPSPRSIMSVTTEWPLLNRTPDIAGSSANASDSPASDEVSGDELSWCSRGLPWGFSRSLASVKLYSEKLELRLGGRLGLASFESRPVGVPVRRRDDDTSSIVVRERRRPWPAGLGLIPELRPLPLLEAAAFALELALGAGLSSGIQAGDR